MIINNFSETLYSGRDVFKEVPLKTAKKNKKKHFILKSGGVLV